MFSLQNASWSNQNLCWYLESDAARFEPAVVGFVCVTKQVFYFRLVTYELESYAMLKQTRKCFICQNRIRRAVGISSTCVVFGLEKHENQQVCLLNHHEIN